MSRALATLLALLLLDRTAASESQQDTARAGGASENRAQDAALEPVRKLLDDARRARDSKDFAAARAHVRDAIERALSELSAREDESAIRLLEKLALFANETGELASAESAWTRVLDVRVRTLSADHFDLQGTRLDFAETLKARGNFRGARELQEQALDALSRTVPDDHPQLTLARQNLGATLFALDDLAGSRALCEKVLEIRSRTLPEDDADLQAARGNLALILKAAGDYDGARSLQQQVLDVFSRTLPEEHPRLQLARSHLANTVARLGDLPGARDLQEKVLEVRLRMLPADHPLVQRARDDLAGTIRQLGDLHRARELEEEVVAVRARTLPGDHRDLQSARESLAITLYWLGDLARARVLQEELLASRARKLADDHRDVQAARQNLAITLLTIGELDEARALFEKVLEVQTRTLAADDAEVLKAKLNLAVTIQRQGDAARARELLEEVVEVRSRTLPGDHPSLQVARANLANAVKALGDLPSARALEEQVLEIRSRTLPDGHPDLQSARENLAWTIAHELALATRTAERAGGEAPARLETRAKCAELIGAMCRAQTKEARAALLEGSTRETETRCANLAGVLAASLSFAGGLGVFEPIPELERDSFIVGETTRAAALLAAALVRRSASDARSNELRAELRRRSEELSTLAQNGATSESFREALARREGVERELVSLARASSAGTAIELDFDVERFARSLGAGDAVVACRRYSRTTMSAATAGQDSVESLCAFVVRPEPAARLTLVDLGPIEPIEHAVRQWREGIGVASDARGSAAVQSISVSNDSLARGLELAVLVVDPLEAVLDGADRVIFVLDDVLHLVPLDALPDRASSGAAELLGDRWRVETRTTVTELCAPARVPTKGGVLAVVGGVAYDGPQSEANEGDARSTRDDSRAGILRGGVWSGGFRQLPATLVEARVIAESFVAEHAEERVTLLEGTDASRERLLELAPRARWLHVATHGWFAPESIRSWSDVEPLDAHTGLGVRSSGAEQVKGMSPMLLCGLALAGANLPEDAVGRVPGLVTADELSTLDLTNCELAVLSACDTNVGERRAGQGVASLQKALQMAGARSVITSLWKVPDEATKELMLDFYRRMWVEKKPKWQALWEAKTRMREAKDERGAPKYTTRDWAAWVLTGAPD